jgi:carboxyl-terminal processing protease
MFTAPPLPPEAKRRGRLFGVLSGLGLSAVAGILLVVNLVLFVATAYFVATPEGLYHRVWRSTAEHIYDPSVLGDWKQWEHKYDGQMADDDDAAWAITQMLESIGDRYTYFMDAKEVKADRERSQGNFTGVGMILGVKTDGHGQPVKAADGNPLPETDDSGYPLIKQLMNGGPAKNAGLKVGDAITSVNGKDTRAQSLDALIGQIRGEAGTDVTFGVRRDGQDLTITVTRQKINIPAVTTKKLPGDIGYLRLEGFDQYDATDEVKAGLAELKESRALIIDLRGNPGGFVHNAINIASLFLEQGTVVTIRSRIPGDPASPQYETQTVRLTATELVTETTDTRDPADKDVDNDDRQPNLSGNRPVVILVNGNSASASEMFTGALKDNGRATVVGTRTFGKGIGQSNLPMPNGTQLHVTSLRYFTPSGTWLGDGGNSQSHGIEPDVVVEPNKNLEFGEDNDNQLQKAIEILNQKLGGGSYRPFFRTNASCAG